MQLHAVYDDCDCADIHHHKLAAPLLEGHDGELVKMAHQVDMINQIWQDKGLPVGTINKQVVADYATKLMVAVTDGFGKAATDFTTPDKEMLAALEANVWQFSAAKNYAQLKAISEALLDDTGKLRTYKEFKHAAAKINNQYVNQWLKTEYDLAVASSQMASKWVTIEAQSENLPLLEFDAVIDLKTSELCRGLNKTILPYNHPFWSIYYPPNHFNCRSTVWQRSKGRITPESKIAAPEIPDMFRVNLAKERLVFPPKHPYFIDAPSEVVNYKKPNE